jgi:hypothetical protein
VAVRTIACWFGTNDATADEVQHALLLVERTMKRQHGWELAALQATPAGTGLDLWRRSIAFDRVTGRSKEYPPLPKELRDLIHHTSGQGNFTYPPACATMLLGNPALYNLDMRLAYAAAAQEELGSAPATHDWLTTYAGFTPARYRAQYHVPDGWGHVGLLMTPDPHSVSGKRSWYFPNTPGFTGECWADMAELRVAQWPFPHICPACAEGFRRNTGLTCPEHGWRMAIKERILFTKGTPLKTWAAKLVQLREDVAALAPTSRIAEMARAAVRNILLYAIGAFHGTSRPITYASQDSADVPDRTPFEIVPTEDGEEMMTWRGEVPRSVFLDYVRPEWPSQIWGRTRARLLLHRDVSGHFTGALTLPYVQIIALRLDSLLVTSDPGWPDDGKVGRFRVKGCYPGPIPWPQSEEDLSQLTEIEVPHI